LGALSFPSESRPTVPGLLGAAVVCPLTCGSTGVAACEGGIGMLTGGIGTSVTGGGEPGAADVVPGAAGA
jgi:hypothetical protein